MADRPRDNDVKARDKWGLHEWEDQVINVKQNSDSNSINLSHLGLASH